MCEGHQRGSRSQDTFCPEAVGMALTPCGSSSEKPPRTPKQHSQQRVQAALG